MISSCQFRIIIAVSTLFSHGHKVQKEKTNLEMEWIKFHRHWREKWMVNQCQRRDSGENCDRQQTGVLVVHGRVAWKTKIQRRLTAGTRLKKQTSVLYLMAHGSHHPAISTHASAAAPLEKVTKREGWSTRLKMVVRIWYLSDGWSVRPREGLHVLAVLFGSSYIPVTCAMQPAWGNNWRTCPKGCAAGCGHPGTTRKQGMAMHLDFFPLRAPALSFLWNIGQISFWQIVWADWLLQWCWKVQYLKFGLFLFIYLFIFIGGSVTNC